MSKPQPTYEEIFAATDFSKKDELVKLFPLYMQEQIAARTSSKKPLSKAISIEAFTMKTPFGDRYLLKNTNLTIDAGKRLGLIGVNGVGKSLLFSNIVHGNIKGIPSHIQIHHCKELEGDELKESVIDTVLHSHQYRNALVRCENKLKELMAADPAPANKDAIKENLEWVQFQMTSIKGYDAKERIEKMLRVLGFDEFGQKKLVSALSGGLRMRVALCIAFFVEADLLLLDEPTNHLDFPSVLWLENRLRGYKGSFVMVSHDRELLNNVCTAVMLMEDMQIKYYMMGFKEFEKKKALEDKKKYEDVEKFLKKNPNADPSTQLGKQRHEYKEWSENYHRRQVAMAGKFTFPAPVALVNTEKDANGNPLAPEDISIINLKDVTFSYDVSTGHFIFADPISFNVTASTRVGVMGPNGAGKSTLLKLLTHKLTPTTGQVTHHPNFTLAYFGQHSTAEMNLELTAIEYMESQFPNVSAGLLRQHLAKTSIVGTVADTRMHRLAYSQRSCIIFAKLTYICPHLLIMDEPTNFLDLESVDSLISACNKYKGALLLVSHNRDFLRKCAKQYLSVVPGHFNLYNDLKTAERSTYTFIAEMEDGGAKVGASALISNPGGGTVHSSQKVGAAATASTSSSSTSSSASAGSIKLVSVAADEKKAAITPSPSGGSSHLPGSAAPTPVGAKPPKHFFSEVTVDTTAAAAASSSSSNSAAAKTDATAPVFAVNEKCQALWKDGKWYPAIVKKFNDKDGRYTITYPDYGNTTSVTVAWLKKAGGAPAAAASAQNNQKNQAAAC